MLAGLLPLWVGLKYNNGLSSAQMGVGDLSNFGTQTH